MNEGMMFYQPTSTPVEVLEDLQQEAEGKVIKTPTGYLVGSFALFMSLVSIALPLAIVTALLPIIVAGRKMWSNGKAVEYFKKTGRFAHVLDDRQLIRLEEIIGRSAVVHQLTEAVKDGKPLTESAEHYLKRCNIKLEVLTDLDAYFDAAEQQVLPGDAKPTVGPDTKLNAVDVAHTPVNETSAEEQPPQPFNQFTEQQQPGIDAPVGPVILTPDQAIYQSMGVSAPASDQFLRDLAKTPQNILALATGGAGKGVVMSNLFRFRHECESNLRVLFIDPKDDPKERGYWDEPWILRYGFKASELTLEQILLHMTKAFSWIMETCANYPELPFLIAIDECLAVHRILTKLGRTPQEKNLLSLKMELTSSLFGSANRHVVAFSQSPNLGDFGISGGVALNFRKMILFRENEIDFLKKAHQNKLINLPAEMTDSYIKMVLESSPLKVRRGVYLDGKLYAMPQLENYSRFDRDTGLYLPGYKQPVELSQTGTQPSEDGSQDEEPEPDDGLSPGASLLGYLERKGRESARKGQEGVSVFTVKQNWAKNKGIGAEDTDKMLEWLESQGKVITFYPDGSKGLWVKLMPTAAPATSTPGTTPSDLSYG